jgi:menaquinone-dependent protoporphyrinogen oxidase
MENVMSNSILLAYATRYGSTQEVAEAIAATLREQGLEVDVQPMKKVRSVKEYRAVVLGAPLYIGSLHKDAQNFLKRYSEALMSQPVAFFVLGPTHTIEKELEESRVQLDKELGKFPGLKLVVREVFFGKYDPAKLRFPDSLIASLPASPVHNEPASDVRDWPAIRAWATSLATQLQPA